MRNLSTPRAADWHEFETAAANTEVVVSRDAASSARHHLISISASYSATGVGELDLYGLTKVGPMDLTDTDVLDLTANTFTFAGHGLTDGQQVVFHSMGGTAPTGLTSGSTYFVDGVDGDNFQLEATVGGGAIDMSGTQANLATGALILPLSLSWAVYDVFALVFPSPLLATASAPLIAKLSAVANLVGKANLSGYSL